MVADNMLSSDQSQGVTALVRHYRFGIVVPVRNERAVLAHTVPALLDCVAGQGGQIIWVCNGCTDGSAEMIRQLHPQDAQIIELATPGKTGALQAGDDALAGLFPRLYLDADVTLRACDLQVLLTPLANGSADLVAARRLHDTAGASRISAAIARTWEELPYARECAFLGAIGISAAGRALWQEWPEVSGDDIFVAAMVPPARRRFVPEAIAMTGAPATFWGWVEMRARWRRGERQIAALGLTPPSAPHQRKALIKRLLTPKHRFGALGFILARLLAAAVPDPDGPGWLPKRGWVDAKNLGI